jgi:hypothetical protein
MIASPYSLLRVDDIGVFILLAIIVGVGALAAWLDDWRTKKKERTSSAAPRRAA